MAVKPLTEAEIREGRRALIHWLKRCAERHLQKERERQKQEEAGGEKPARAA